MALYELRTYTLHADRRAHWAGLSANKDFAEGFASMFRPSLWTRR